MAGLPIARSASKPNQIIAAGRLLLLCGWPPNCQVNFQTKQNTSCWENATTLWLASQLPGKLPTQTKPNNSCWETATTVWLASKLTGQFPNQIIADGRLLLLCGWPFNCQVNFQTKPNQTKPSKYSCVAGFLIARPVIKPSLKKPTKHSIVGCFY